MKVLRLYRWVLGTALAGALGSFAGFGWTAWKSEHARRKPSAHRSDDERAYRPKLTEPMWIRSAPWRAPQAQPRGAAWVYDVFTPPEIFYDSQLAAFVVTPPGEEPELANDATAPAEMELMAVRRAWFPLQLLGYVGKEGRLLGSFESEVTGEVFLAGAGRKLPTLALTIVGLAVQRRAGSRGAGIMAERMAVATVQDDRTGRTTTLNSQERATTDELIATVAVAGEADERTRIEVREGEPVRVAGRAYTLSRLQVEPPRAVLGELSPGGSTLKQWKLAARPPETADPDTPADE